MALSDIQYGFAKDLIELMMFIRDDKTVNKFSIGEVWRPEEWQRQLFYQGKSKLLHGRHQDKLAADLYFWIDNIFVQNSYKNVPRLEHIGTYWEALHEKNRWGGHYRDFCDLNHFERLRT